MELIKTGIPGFDEVLKGGLRRGSCVMVDGAPGTGKTILATQFIIEGARNNEPGLFITLEESVESLLEYSKEVGIPLAPYVKKGIITILQQPISAQNIMDISEPLNIIKTKKVKRVVLDSLSLFEYAHEPGSIDFRKEILNFLIKMKEAGVTFISTSQQTTLDVDKIMFQPEDFLFDGLVIMMKIRKLASFERTLTVAKMRGQDHLMDIFPLAIEKGGVRVFPDQLPFSLIEQDAKKR